MNIELAPFKIDDYDRCSPCGNSARVWGLAGRIRERTSQFYLARNPDMSFLAQVEDALVGAVLCGHDGRRGFIWHLAVHPEFRHQGIGRRLVERCCARFDKHASKNVWLSCSTATETASPSGNASGGLGGTMFA